ncbi:MAG TPA: CocE/NonD family hydrolase [Terriglobales bacterium]|nr:CocE/NonD family hydrolase [Terriglobales bacterium]
MKRTLGEDLPRTWPPLQARVESSFLRQGYRIDQVSAEFWPGVRYAIQVYVPSGKPPFPGIVMAATGRTGPRHPHYQVMGGAFARMGFLVVAALPLGKGVGHPAYQYNGIALLAGTSIAQEQFHTGRRALDYLMSRPDVDPRRVGMIGASDGGWTTLYVSTFDRRIVAIAPASTNYTFCGLLLPKLWKTMNEAEGNAPEVLTYRANIPTLTACNAPRWMHFINSEYEGHRLQYIPVIDGAARAAYEFANAGNRYSSHIAPCPHGLWPVAQIEAISWFLQVFLGRRPPEGTFTLQPVRDGEFEKLIIDGIPVEVVSDKDPEFGKLRVGQLGDDAGGPGFLQIIGTRRRDARHARASLAKNPARMRRELTRCLGLNGLDMNPRATVEGDRVTLETESGLRVFGRWVRPAADKADPVYLVVGTSVDRSEGLDLGDAARFDLQMREEGVLGPDTWALVMLNRPPIGMWAWDVMSAARWLSSQGYRRVRLAGVGDAGAVIAILAGTLAHDFASVEVHKNQIRSLDEDVVGKKTAYTPYWAHRLLWVADLPELAQLLQAEGRWKAIAVGRTKRPI